MRHHFITRTLTVLFVCLLPAMIVLGIYSPHFYRNFLHNRVKNLEGELVKKDKALALFHKLAQEDLQHLLKDHVVFKFGGTGYVNAYNYPTRELCLECRQGCGPVLKIDMETQNLEILSHKKTCPIQLSKEEAEDIYKKTCQFLAEYKKILKERTAAEALEIRNLQNYLDSADQKFDDYITWESRFPEPIKRFWRWMDRVIYRP